MAYNPKGNQFLQRQQRQDQNKSIINKVVDLGTTSIWSLWLWRIWQFGSRAKCPEMNRGEVMILVSLHTSVLNVYIHSQMVVWDWVLLLLSWQFRPADTKKTRMRSTFKWDQESYCLAARVPSVTLSAAGFFTIDRFRFILPQGRKLDHERVQRIITEEVRYMVWHAHKGISCHALISAANEIESMFWKCANDGYCYISGLLFLFLLHSNSNKKCIALWKFWKM